MYVTQIRSRSRFCSFFYTFFWVLRLSWPSKTSWQFLWTSSKFISSKEVFKRYKNSFKHEQKRGRFLAVSRDFRTNFCFLRLPWPQRMFKEAAMMSTEVMVISKSKNSYKNCLKMRSKFSISSNEGVTFINFFPPKETRLHKQSLSWQEIVNLFDFCVLRLPWPPRMWALAYRRMPSGAMLPRPYRLTSSLGPVGVGDRHSPIWQCSHPRRSGQPQNAKIKQIRDYLPWETQFMKSSLLGCEAVLCNTGVHAIYNRTNFCVLRLPWPLRTS